MSFFYLTPVKGDMPVHLLEAVITQRLAYLKTIIKGDPVVYSEYVVEGSIYDNVGHFMLCIVAILGDNTAFSQLFFTAEVELFSRRLAVLSAYDMRSFAKKLLRNTKKSEHVPRFVTPLQALCQHLMIKDIAHHVCSIHSCNCTVHSIRLCFKHCLNLIAKRLVELNNGVALLPCGMWKQYIITLFKDNLRFKMNNTNLTSLRNDPRIIQLVEKIKSEFPCTKVSGNILKSRDVDDVSMFFPPCMLNLHQSLRKKHRLSHTQRFHYSLFLKDIGMPIEEAIDFWRKEYSFQPNGSHSCCHSWEKDEKKYLYGIRHMYGLEGCRKSYASVNCNRIQSIDNACSEGGCPFKSFDSSKMVPLLKNCPNPLLTKINEFKTKTLYTSACMLFLQSNCIESIKYCDNYTFNFTPVKYFTLAHKKTEMDL